MEKAINRKVDVMVSTYRPGLNAMLTIAPVDTLGQEQSAPVTGNGLVFTAEIGDSISFVAGCIMEKVTDGFGSWNCPDGDLVLPDDSHSLVTFTFKNPVDTEATIYADFR